MTIYINGTTGISGVDGSAGTPAVQGTDTNTGVFYPAADTVGVSTGGSERVRVDSSGNVGIGTTNTTDQRLKVKQSADTGASSFSFKVEANANDTGLYIGYRGAGAATAADTCAITATYGSTGAFKPMTFLTSDAERMRIDSSGNVGIGTTAPKMKLNAEGTYGNPVTSGATPTGIARLSQTTNNVTLDFGVTTGNRVWMQGADKADLSFTYDIVINPNGGNVGIGTASPAVKLDVNGITGWGGGTTGQTAQIVGANSGILNGGNFRVLSNTTQAADVGGALTLGGYYTTTTASVDFGAIFGAKENSTGGNTAGYLAFGTRPNAGNMTERMRIDSSGNLLFNSGYGSVATAYGCRAWVNFNGTGTVAIRASGNVTSITDNGVGDYTVNFTTAMPDANYSCVTSAARTINNAFMSSIYYSGGLVAGSARVRCWEDAGAAQDPNVFCVSIFR